MGVLLYICCIFSEQLFLRTRLGDWFCTCFPNILHTQLSWCHIVIQTKTCFICLRENKLRHNFHDTFNLLNSCSRELETTSQYLLGFYKCSSACSALMNSLDLTGSSFAQISATAPSNILLIGDSRNSIWNNSQILRIIIKYIFANKTLNISRDICSLLFVKRKGKTDK